MSERIRVRYEKTNSILKLDQGILLSFYHRNYCYESHHLFFRYEPLCVSLYPLEVNW